MKNRAMGKWAPVVAAVLAGTVLSNPVLHAAAVGDKPTLQFRAIDGREVDLQKLRGKLVVVDFWTCTDLGRGLEAELVRIHTKFADQGVEFIGICCDRDLERSKLFIEDLGMKWPHYWDGQAWQSRVVTRWDNARAQTCVLGPDGVVIWVGSARMLARDMPNLIDKHPPHLVDDQVLAAAIAALDATEKAMTAKDRLGAIGHFGQIASAARKDRKVDQRWTALQPKVEQAAQDVIADAEKLIEQKQMPEAVGQLLALEHAFEGMPADGKARQKLRDLMRRPEMKAEVAAQAREKEAAGALEAARKLQAAQDHAGAYARFVAIARDYAGTPSSAAAGEAVKAYESDKEMMRKIQSDTIEAQAKALLSLARGYANAKRTDMARERYQEIIDRFPQTTSAEAAKREIEKLR